MKRFLIYFLTYILVTIFSAVIVWGIWTLLTGASQDTMFDKASGVIQMASSPLARADQDKTLLADRWRIQFTQNIKVSYQYNGKKYVEERELVVHTDYYDTEVSPQGKTYNTPYVTGAAVQIFVNKQDPSIFQLADTGEAHEVPLKDVLKFAIPAYALIMILFTISFIKKEKRVKKENFYHKYGMDRDQF